MKFLKLLIISILVVTCLSIGSTAEAISLFETRSNEINHDRDASYEKYGDEIGSAAISTQNFGTEEFSKRRRMKHTEFRSRSKRYNKALTLENYNSDEPPPVLNGVPTPVRFNVLVFSVRGINEILQEISVDMRLQLSWKDHRLNNWLPHIPPGNKYLGISLKKMKEMWTPDIFVDYVKGVDQPKLISEPASLRLYKKNDYFRFSTRITLKMDCPMQFRYYPADLQTCKIEMKSYAYPDEVLQLDWMEDKRSPLMLLEQGLDAPNFELSLAKHEKFVIKTNSGQNYTGIRFRVQLQRQLSYHMMQTYVPSSLFVLVSMLSFLVPPESVPGRMTICMTTLLTLTAMWSAVRSNIPKVSYIKALDIWMVACVFFVCLALIQYTVILNLRNRKQKPKPPGDDTEKKSSSASTPSVPPTGPFAKIKDKLNMLPSTSPGPGAAASDAKVDSSPVNAAQPDKYEEAVKFLESYTWMSVAILFIVFNLIYWPWLLISSEYFVPLDDTVYYQ